MARKLRKHHSKESRLKSSHEGRRSQDDLMKLSFKYLDLRHSKFNPDNKEGRYFLKVLERYKEFTCIDRKSLVSLMSNSNKTWRFHKVDFSDSRVSEDAFNIPGEDQLVGEDVYQFSVSGNEYGRVIGFLISTTFYVVWLDHGHELYPG